jgi:hypothetical protein
MSSLPAWVLLAISLATNDEPVTLDRVISAADAVNHSVLNAEEIESAFRALTSVGLITPGGAQVALTLKGEALTKAAQLDAAEPGSWMSQLNILEKMILQLPSIPLTEQQESRLPSKADAESAIQAYIAKGHVVGPSELHALQERLIAKAAAQQPLGQKVVAAITRLLRGQ